MSMCLRRAVAAHGVAGVGGRDVLGDRVPHQRADVQVVDARGRLDAVVAAGAVADVTSHGPTLLHDVGQLVGQQVLAGAGARRVQAGREVDVGPGRERVRRHPCRERAVGVHAHVGERGAEPGLHPGERASTQGCPTRRRLDAAGQLAADVAAVHPDLRPVAVPMIVVAVTGMAGDARRVRAGEGADGRIGRRALEHPHDLVGDTVGLGFQRVVGRPDDEAPLDPHGLGADRALVPWCPFRRLELGHCGSLTRIPAAERSP